MSKSNQPDATIIRRATANDLDQIVKLCGAHAEFEGATFKPSGHAGRLEIAISGIEPRLHLFIAEVKGRTVGYASASREFSTWAACEFLHMDCLFVLEHMRGHGIGKKLVRAIFDTAHNLSISEIQWQTPTWNTDAINFYRSIGATDKTKARFTLTTA